MFKRLYKIFVILNNNMNIIQNQVGDYYIHDVSYLGSVLFIYSAEELKYYVNSYREI
jgi:hypothetical protein